MNKFILTTAGLLIAFSVNAQKKIKVNEGTEKIAGGNNNTLTVLIYEASASDIEKDWKSKMKDYNAKVGNQKGEIFADNALISDFGSNTVDVYAKVIDNKDGSVTLWVAYDLGGAFLSSSAHPEQYKAARDMMYRFAVEATKKAVGNQLSDAQKSHKKMEKEQENLERDQENLKKDIENYKAKIADAEKAIEENSKAQQAKKAEIEAQKKAVSAIENKLKAVE